MFVLPLARPSQRVAGPQITRAFDRLFDESFARVSVTRGLASLTPALDVTETDTAYTLTFDVPGVARDVLKVSIEGRRVVLGTIDAVPAVAEPVADASAIAPAANNAAEPVAMPTTQEPAARVLYRERNAPRYARTVSLPAEVDQSASQAKLEHGVLTLTLTKKIPTGATRLNIG